MKNKKLILKEEADDEIKFADDDVFYSEEEPLPPIQTEIPVVVDEPVEVEVPTEIVHTAYNDILQDLLKKQWDVINSCDAITATLDSEEGVEFDKEAVKAILQTIADETTKAIGMTTKAMTLIDPAQDELMKEGERQAEDAINASEKEVVDGDLEEDTRAEKNLEAVPLSTYVNKWSKYSRYGIPQHAREVNKDEFEDELKDKPDALRIVREFFDEHPKAYSCIIKYYYNKYKEDEEDTIHYVVSDTKSDLYTYLKDAIRDIESGRFGTGRTIIYEIPNDYEKEYGDDMSHLGNENIIAEFENCKPIKEELLGEATDIWGLFAIEIDPKTGRKIADVEGGKAIERGSKEELQPKVREYESSWNVNPQGKTYRFSLKRITSESMDEDLAMISQMNSGGFHGFDDVDEYLRYWAWYALGELEAHLDNLSSDGELDDLDEDDDYQIINHLSEEDIINLCVDMAGCLCDNDYLWETAYSVFCDCLHDVIVQGNYADRAIPEIQATVQLGGNNPNEGEQ